MFCRICGKELRDDSRFCQYCGADLEDNPNSGFEEKRRQSFQGELLKCPNCGELLKAYQSVCPACNYEFRNAKSSNALKIFSERLDALESQRVSSLDGDTFIDKISGTDKTDYIEEQILSHIRNFSVPNTKEDVFEFFILASSNIDTDIMSISNDRQYGFNNTKENNRLISRTKAWIAKEEQVYQKAKISFGTDPDFSKIQNIYDQTAKSIKLAEKKRAIRSFSPALGPVLAVVGFVVVVYFIFASVDNAHSKLEKKLENTVQEIQIDIDNNVSARLA